MKKYTNTLLSQAVTKNMGIVQKYDSFKKYLQIFSTPMDALKFIKILKSTEPISKLISLKLKETKGHPIFLRTNTTDIQVLQDTFIWKYHVPPFNLGKNPTILDLGANVGYTMAHFAYLYDNSQIIGVELDKSNYLLAKKNLESINNQCTIINAGIWSKNEKISYGGDEEWGYKISRDLETSESIGLVETKTIDTILEENNIEEIDFLKIDIEGAEKEIFQHPEKWINKIKSIKMEIHPPATFDWCFKILEKYDFQCSKDTIHPSAILGIKN